MLRDSRSMRDREPNWKMAFGSGAFLVVWLLGLAAGLPLDLVLFRAVVGALLGAVLGVVVGMVLKGLADLAREPEKGHRVDFTVAAGDEEMPAPGMEMPAEAARVVPQAAPADPFTPIDLKSAAKHVQGMVNE